MWICQMHITPERPGVRSCRTQYSTSRHFTCDNITKFQKLEVRLFRTNDSAAPGSVAPESPACIPNFANCELVNLARLSRCNTVVSAESSFFNLLKSVASLKLPNVAMTPVVGCTVEFNRQYVPERFSTPLQRNTSTTDSCPSTIASSGSAPERSILFFFHFWDDGPLLGLPLMSRTFDWGFSAADNSCLPGQDHKNSYLAGGPKVVPCHKHQDATITSVDRHDRSGGPAASMCSTISC